MKQYVVLSMTIVMMCVVLIGCPESDDDREVYTTVRSVDEMEGVWDKTSYIGGDEYDVAFFEITQKLL